MIINKVICDRCGAEIEGEAHPPRLVMQTYVVSTKIAVQSAYKTDSKIHLCDDCSKSFKEFMNYER